MLSSLDKNLMALLLTDAVMLDASGADTDTDGLSSEMVPRKRFYAVQALTDVVLGANTKNKKILNNDGEMDGIELSAGMVVTGDFDRITITQGVLLCYITRYDPKRFKG